MPDETTEEINPRGVTLCLSGGGYRAAAFTAGALLAVRDTNLWKDLKSISSVSGGSITSAVTMLPSDVLQQSVDFNLKGGAPAPITHRELTEDQDFELRITKIARLVQSDTLSLDGLSRGAKLILVTFSLWALVGLIVVPSLSDQHYFDSIPVFYEYNIPSLYNALGLNLLAYGLVGIVLCIFAVLKSLVAVQAVVEEYTNDLWLGGRRKNGFSLSDYNPESIARIYCATDVESGEHTYIGSDRVLRPIDNQQGGSLDSAQRPSLLLSDVVAASAGFPGLRPLVFRLRELGMADNKTKGLGTPRPIFIRGALGVIGIALLLVPMILIASRSFGYFGTLAALGWLVLVLLAGAAVALLVCRYLASTDGVELVDGGICDNLGAAFPLVTGDPRYLNLRSLLRVHNCEETIVLVVDASKPLSKPAKPRLFEPLIPLRFRVISRSITQLIGSANGHARLVAIQDQLARPPFSGAIISILVQPSTIDNNGQFTQNAFIPTGLSGLTRDQVVSLLLHGYRLTQEILVSKPGWEVSRRRSDNDISGLVPEAPRRYIPKLAKRTIASPYCARRRWINWGLGLFSIVAFFAPLGIPFIISQRS